MANLRKNDLESPDRRAVVYWLILVLLLLLALLPSYRITPAIPDDALLNLWWSISFSASKYGLVWVGLLIALLIEPGWKKTPVLLLPVLLLIGTGAWLNEHVIKPAIAEPRPSVSFLASAAAGPVLEEGVDAFYALPDKSSRSEYLARQLAEESRLRLPPLLREHWIEEAGYSFPSGHAFAATALASWFMFVILSAGKRLWLLPVLWGWGAAVAYSRIMLGVHRPEDILAGAVEGVLLVAVVLSLAWRSLDPLISRRE